MLMQTRIESESKSNLPPGPKSMLPGGQMLAFSRDPLKFLLTIAREYGDIVHFKIGPENLFLLNHPDYINDVFTAHEWNFLKGPLLQKARNLLGKGLLTSEGNLHRRQRRLSQPAFHHQRIAGYAQTMIDRKSTR